MICRVCDAPESELDLAIDLGEQPWANHFLRPEEVGTEPFYPLRVLFCQRCSTAQLDYTVPKETMFSDHTYLSGVTKSLSAHFASVAEAIDREFGSGRATKAVLDIGSNDGTQLEHFKRLGWDVLGVEASRTTAAIANEAGVETINAFFNEALVRDLGRQFDVINAAGVFFHLEELHSVTDGIRLALTPDGVFVVQFLYMQRIVENCAFDQIYHEHLLYYNLRTIEALLNRHGLALFDATLSPIHGGSIIAYAGHAGRRAPSDRLESMRAAEDSAGANELPTYHEFARRIQDMKRVNLEYLDQAKAAGKTIFGLGAPVKGNTLLNTFGVGRQYLDCLVEKNELRRGLVSPGMHLPLLIERELPNPPDVYYVLAWNFKREILANNADLLARGVEFFFPVNPRDA